MRREIAVAITCNLWGALLGLGMVPLYIGLMGVASYGLMGIYGSLVAITTLFDLGFTATAARQAALFAAGRCDTREVKDLLHTMQSVYLGIGIIIVAGVALSSGFVASQWLHASTLSVKTIQRAVVLMGFALCGQWPFSFYAAALMGLGRQIEVAVAGAAAATLRAAGAVVVLLTVAPTIEAFLTWQVVISTLTTIIVAVMLWTSLPRRPAPSFRASALAPIRRFAGGVSIASVIGVILVQVDKIVLSKLLALELFGYYTLASVVSGGVYLVVQPIYNVVAPRFVGAVSRSAQAVADLYHDASQTMALFLLPCVALLAVFSHEVLWAWTGNMVTADRTSIVLRILVVGSALYALAFVPWAVQLAYGWTSLGVKLNTIAVIGVVPATVILALRYGAIGGACAWLLLNVFKTVFGQYAMHRQILRGELRSWVEDSVAVPGIAAVISCSLAKLMLPVGVHSRLVLSSFLVLTFAVTVLVTGATLPVIRRKVRAHFGAWTVG